MTQVKRRTIGDNSGNINPIEEEAIALIQQMQDSLKKLKFDSWFKVIDAKARGVDVHHAPIKTHKLEIVSGNKTRFGQWLINRNEDC